MSIYYYEDGELPVEARPRPGAPGVWRQFGRDVLALVCGCAVFAAVIVASDWWTR